MKVLNSNIFLYFGLLYSILINSIEMEKNVGNQSLCLGKDVKGESGCCKCAHYQTMMEKYAKLVELLNKKIIQLSKKLYTKDQTQWVQREEEQTSSTFKKSQKTDDRGSQIKDVSDVGNLQETDDRLNENNLKSGDKTGGTHDMFWRCGPIVNSLTEQVIQLKSNFMHIRQCVYSLFQQSKMWSFIKKSQTGVNVAMVLFNIFEYSQQQRQQMCRMRKVKVKTIRRQQSKQNKMYRTVKDICQ